MDEAGLEPTPHIGQIDLLRSTAQERSDFRRLAALRALETGTAYGEEDRPE